MSRAQVQLRRPRAAFCRAHARAQKTRASALMLARSVRVQVRQWCLCGTVARAPLPPCAAAKRAAAHVRGVFRYHITESSYSVVNTGGIQA